MASHRNHASALSTLPINNERVGKPRLDPNLRRTNRLYEMLFLLKVLGQTRGKHTPGSTPLSNDEACRRRFIRNLAYVCDYDKGGVTCTAIAVEETQKCYRFWVASNGDQKEIACFLTAVLTSLHDYVRSCEGFNEEREENGRRLLQMCIKFARRRVKEDVKILSRAMREWGSRAQVERAYPDRQLCEWLLSIIRGDDCVSWCQQAYRASKTPSMDTLTAKARLEELTVAPRRKGLISSIRHQIGRLAYHVSAHNQLVEDADQLGHMVETFEVCTVDTLHSVARPVPDHHTTLSGILNRMLQKGDPMRAELEQTLLQMEDRSGLLSHFVGEFDKCRPKVHAEIQLLEYFYEKKLKFVANDRYIACSKPACFCCKLYFKYHPARMIEPRSHEKIWPSWGPPTVSQSGSASDQSVRQRDILNRIIEALRNDAIAQILRTSQPPSWHPDSQTEISEIIAREALLQVNATTDDSDPDVHLATSSSDFFESSDDGGGGVAIDT